MTRADGVRSRGIRDLPGQLVDRRLPHVEVPSDPEHVPVPNLPPGLVGDPLRCHHGRAVVLVRRDVGVTETANLAVVDALVRTS